MAKVIKEIMIMLLVCLLGMLIFAVAFYEFIPNRKAVPEVVSYEATEKVKALMADDIDQRDDQVVLNYKVTSSDLNNYKVTKDYVPGKANPFAPVSKDPETRATTSNSGNSGNSGNGNSGSTQETNTGTESSTSENNTSSLIDDGGTK